MQVFNSVSTAIDFSIDSAEFIQKHYPTVRKYTMWAALVALYFALDFSQKAIAFFRYSCQSAVESGRIVGAGFYEVQPIALLAPAAEVEEIPDVEIDLVQLVADLETVHSQIQAECLTGQFTPLACYLGEWDLGKSGKVLKSTMHLERAYAKAVDAELAHGW